MSDQAVLSQRIRDDLDVLSQRIRDGRDLPPPAVRRALRIAAGLSLRDIAGAVGCSHQAVSHWERGDRYPRPAHLSRYADGMRLLAGGSEGGRS